MTYRTLTANQQNRFRKARTCPICNKIIDNDTPLTFKIIKIGKVKQYIFYHKECKDVKERQGKKQKEA